MLSLTKPLIFGSTELKNLIFQRKDIYCLLEEFVQKFGTSFDNLYSNDDNLRKQIEDNYNSLILKIQEILSGHEVEFDFIPKNGSITLEKLSQEVLNIISNNVTIDPIENILTDINSGKKYKLTPYGEDPTVIYGDIEIVEFVYPNSVIGTQGISPNVSFKQNKTIAYPDGRIETETLEGNNYTQDAKITFSTNNIPSWIDVNKNTGTIVANLNQTFDDVTVKVKATIEWHDKNIQTGEFTLTQPGAYVIFTPSTKNIDSTVQTVSIDINKSSNVEIIDFDSNEDFCNVSIIDRTLTVDVEENPNTTYRQAIITVSTKLADITKNFIVSINQAGKVVVNEFYYGGSADENSIPVTTEGLTKTNTLEEFSYTIDSLDLYKCIVVNLPNTHAIEYIKDSGGNIMTMASGSPATNGNRKIYYTKQSPLVPLSGTFKIKIKKI